VNLPELSIRRPVFAWMLMAAIILFGWISFTRLGISQLPDVDFPVVTVSLTLPGAAPEVVESQVLDPLEDAIMELDGIVEINSTAQQASGSIAVQFDLNRDIDRSMQQIQNKINQVQNLLPVTLYPPTLRKSNPEDTPIIWIAVTTDDPNVKPIDLMIYTRNVLFDQFAMLPGVGNVALGGYVDPALRIWADVNRLDKVNMTSDDLIQSIFDGHLETPSGIISNDKKEYNVRLMGEADSPKAFASMGINSRATLGPNFRHITLGDVAVVEEGIADIRKIARYNNKRTAALGILKQHGSNAVDVANSVRKKLKEITPLIPPGWHADLRSDNTRFIKQSVDELLFTLGLSALLTAIVCYLFLGSLTSTMNVLMAIPTSIIGTFTAFLFFNFTLNTFTLLGLSLAIGIVVDDAIMMLENIVRHREMGQGKKEAALNGSVEITFAALAATIAVCAIFLPVVFMQGVIGRYFLQYGITVTVAVLLSLLEALTLTPMRCSRYLKIDHDPKGIALWMNTFFHKLALGYTRILSVLLAHRIKTVIVAVFLFLASLLVAKKVPSEMMPAQDQSQMMLRFKLPVGTALPVTNDKMSQVEKYILQQPEVDGIFSVVGGFGGDAVNQGQAFVTLVDPDKRKATQTELIQKYRKELKHKISGMEIVVQDLSLRGFAATRGFPVEFIVQGPNWDKLFSVTNDIMDKLTESKKLVDVNTDVQPNMQEVRITPNRQKLAQHAVSLVTVTNVINALVGGDIMDGKTMYPKGGHRYQMELRLVETQRDKVADLDRIKFRNNRGEVIPLRELVDIKIEPSLMLISRLNRFRAIKVYANPAPGVSQQEAMKLTQQITKSMLPPGYTLEMTGSSQSFQESFRSLLIALAMGILVSYMVLASQFNSFIHPITVLMALPFSFSGAFIGLLVTHNSINIYSLIGFILLMGIVKKNSILLVDFTNQMRAEGLNVHDALIKACPVRLRPILMTSIAVVAGALPEAMSLGPGAETTIPMATAIIGGVIASTFLTLFIVPCVYSLLTYFEQPDTLEAEVAPVKVARA
jgi:hydrophobe/amphiphile efflux-1 (HAE1) family protein